MHHPQLRTIVTLLMASFMAVVLPACWYGALTTAAILGTDGPSTSNSNEERDEHQAQDEPAAAPHRTRPPVPPARSSAERPLDRHRMFADHSPVKIAGSIAPPVHPSQFSVRRLR